MCGKTEFFHYVDKELITSTITDNNLEKIDWKKNTMVDIHIYLTYIDYVKNSILTILDSKNRVGNRP